MYASGEAVWFSIHFIRLIPFFFIISHNKVRPTKYWSHIFRQFILGYCNGESSYRMDVYATYDCDNSEDI